MLTTVSIFLIKKTFGMSEKGDIVLFDPHSDVLFEDQAEGHDEEFALSWRRFGQESPSAPGLVDNILNFRTNEHPLNVMRDLQQNILGQYPTIHPDVVADVAQRIVSRITMARQTGDNWQYRHSSDYFTAVNELQFETSDHIVVWEDEVLEPVAQQ